LRDYHFDGLRLDAVHALIDTSACHFLEQLAAEVDTLEAVVGRHLTLIAESDLNDPRVVRPREAGGLGMDAQWSDDFHHAVHALLTGERSGYYEDFGEPAHVASALQDAYVYGGAYSRHRRRPHGRRPYNVPGWRFVAAVQNHDQVGNRAAGERLTHLLSPGRLKIAAALLLSSPFIPLLFQGEEWGASTPFQYFTAHEDDDLAVSVSEGRRNEFAAFGWDPASIPDPQAEETFNRSRLRWEELADPRHAPILEWYRALIRLRRGEASLRDGAYHDVEVTYDEQARQLTICRGTMVVACNLDGASTTIAIPGVRRLVLASEPDIELRGATICLPSESVALLERVRTSSHASGIV
jgi:maltooligosyltrehalose trehalohydrolase